MEKPEAQELLTIHATLCKAIADPTRIALLYEIGDGPRHVNQLVDVLAIPQATVSRHLKVLRDASLVATRRDGPYIFYELADRRVLEALNLMRAVRSDILARQQILANAIAPQ